jgi:hypothetical protein
LHHNISLGNVLLSQCLGNEVVLGLLIDFNYSELMDDKGTSNDDVGTKGLCSDGDGNGNDDGDGSNNEDDDEPLWMVCGFYCNSLQ